MTRKLDNNSFGFETSKFHSTLSKSEETGGLEGGREIKVTKEPSNAYVQRNIRKVVGYIPIVGIFSSIGQARELIKYKDQPYKALHILRIAFQAVGLGSLFLIPDLAKTYFNYKQTKKEEINESLLSEDSDEYKTEKEDWDEVPENIMQSIPSNYLGEFKSMKSLNAINFYDGGKILYMDKSELFDREKFDPAWLKQAILFYGSNFLSVKHPTNKELSHRELYEIDESLNKKLIEIFSSKEFKQYEHVIANLKDKEQINELTLKFYTEVLPKYFNKGLTEEEKFNMENRVNDQVEKEEITTEDQNKIIPDRKQAMNAIKMLNAYDFYEKGEVLSINKNNLFKNDKNFDPAWLKQAILFYGANFLAIKRAPIRYLRHDQAIEIDKSLTQILKKLFSSKEFKDYEKKINNAKDEKAISMLTFNFYHSVLPKYFNEGLNQEEISSLSQRVKLVG